jgi:Uma2 family endonuclease
MTTRSVYDPRVDHPPRLLTRPLPSGRELTRDDLCDDPYWSYSVVDGVLVAVRPGHAMTAEDLEAIPKQPLWKYEVIDGTLMVSRNAPGERHHDCAATLYVMFREACPPGLKPMIAPFEYRPSEIHSVQPDVMIVRRSGGDLDYLAVPPVLVVEVLSPSTQRYDRTKKWDLYRRTGVEHYWIVDPVGPSIEAFRLVDDEYVPATKAIAGQIFTVQQPVSLRFAPWALLDK